MAHSVNAQELFNRLRASVSTLTTGQLATLGIAFVAVVGITIGGAYWVNAPTYAVLFSDMEPESAGAVVERLKTANVAYVIDDGGRTVRVQASRLDELRLEFAAQGLPGSGRIGFEIFDRTTFGVTDFMEHVNYRRALEGELARTITAISEVVGARVHIAIPQPSLFVGQQQPAKASVVLKLRNSRQLDVQTVNAITGLVAASVESLTPEAVVVIDTLGRPLARMTDASNEVGTREQLERKERIEHGLSTRVVALLEPIVGVGRARVNVSTRIREGVEEQTEERYDPVPIIRSQQTVNQSAAGTAPVQGVAGARANLPPDASGDGAESPPPAPEPVAPPAGSVQVAQTTNYEISKLVTHRVEPSGQIARLSVAVLLDDARQSGDDGEPVAVPRTADEIQKIHDLVAASVGLDVERGDQLTVENISFEDLAFDTEDIEIAPAPWWRVGPEVLEALRILGIVVIAALALFGVVRPMVRGSLGGLPATTRGVGGVEVPRKVQELENEIEAKLQAAGENARALPLLAKRAAALTQKEPENAARLLRAWLSEEPR